MQASRFSALSTDPSPPLRPKVPLVAFSGDKKFKKLDFSYSLMSSERVEKIAPLGYCSQSPGLLLELTGTSQPAVVFDTDTWISWPQSRH